MLSLRLLVLGIMACLCSVERYGLLSFIEVYYRRKHSLSYPASVIHEHGYEFSRIIDLHSSSALSASKLQDVCQKSLLISCVKFYSQS